MKIKSPLKQSLCFLLLFSCLDILCWAFAVSGLNNAEHSVLAFRDPFVEQKVGKPAVFLLELKTAHHYTLYEVASVRHTLHQPIFFPKEPVLFKNILSHLFKDVRIIQSWDAFEPKHMYYFFYIELVLFFAAQCLGLDLWHRCFLKTHFLKILFKLIEALFVGVVEEYLSKKIKQVDDSVGVGEDVII